MDDGIIVDDEQTYTTVATKQTTGGHVWDAARELLRFFQCPAGAGMLDGQLRVLELGAGTGWLGMQLASRFEIGEMVMTEMCDGAALEWLQHNLNLNSTASNVRAAALDWAWCADGATDIVAAASVAEREACTEILGSNWDLVVGSDLVYNEIGAAMLPRVMAALASRGLLGGAVGATPTATRVLYAHTLNRYEFLDREFFKQCALNGLRCVELWPEHGRVHNDESSDPDAGFSGQLFPEQQIVVLEMQLQKDPPHG
jgi:hypothetical protein